MTTLRDLHEDTDEMEWEEMRRDERLALVRKKKEGWEMVKVARDLTVEVMEKAVSWTEEKSTRELIDEIVHEGWRRLEYKRVLIARQLAMEMMEKAVSWAEERSTRKLVEEIVQEGWRRIEIKRVLKVFSDSEGEIQRRVLEICIHRQKKQESLVEILRLE